MDSVFVCSIVSFLLVHQCVLCQVCNETRSIYREVPETYRFSFIETYEEPCLIFCSVKTRQSVNVTTRMVQRFENVTVNVCCEGYIEDDNHEGNGLYCEPVCNPPCQNGYCRRPNQCACEAGYALDPLDPHACKPLCLEGCETANCISTKTPQCFSSNQSEPITEKESPVCTQPCINSNCVGPETCQCFHGYHQTSAYNCEPTSYFVTESCEHGTLIGPYTCLCDEGWQWKCGSCQPICNECNHGTCKSPEQCECNHGYVMKNGKCEPQCSKGCANGKCVTPEFCSCDPGWYKTEEGECKAHCDMNCEHGDCIVPNVCECHIGYQLYIYKEISKCVPNRKDCEDFSSNPKECKCDAPYEVRYFGDNGGDCECIGDCYNSSSLCTKATCLFMDRAFDMNPPEQNYNLETDNKTVDLNNPDVKEFEIPPSMFPNSEINKNMEYDSVTLPDLNYDYDSDETESDDQLSVSEVSPDNSVINSTLPTAEGKNNTEILSANETTSKINHDDKEETDRIIDLQVSFDKNHSEVSMPPLSEENKNLETINSSKTKPDIHDGNPTHKTSEVIPNLQNTTEISTQTDIKKKEIMESTKTATFDLNADNVVNERKALKFADYWIIGIGIFAILMTLLIFGFVVKRICSKKHSLTSSDKNDEVIVQYTSKSI